MNNNTQTKIPVGRYVLTTKTEGFVELRYAPKEPVREEEKTTDERY